MGDKVPKFVVFLDNFDNTGRKVCCKVSLYKNVSGKVIAQSIAFRVVSIYWQGDDHFSLKSWLQVTYPLLKAARFDTFCLVAPQPQELEKEVQLHLTRTRMGFSTSHQPTFYTAPNFLKMGIKCLNLSSFGQFRQYRTKSLVQSFII